MMVFVFLTVNIFFIFFQVKLIEFNKMLVILALSKTLQHYLYESNFKHAWRLGKCKGSATKPFAD
ncbi:hypothetical protein CLV60_108300 [Dyadobacter jiangsuensis]|uniref:Uncharacterized protein n=1 Tax=Dyadobacter jiangsuensis TaxID=1591085 RepID=A0A2P8G0E0_9BACT|nr:hypothetical protein CLV60_108300 [Dyadobacter jiangsuensis]